MNIQEKLQLIGTYRWKHLLFFKEGNFRKCYNEHAMYFTQHIKPMKVHTRFYKNMNTYVHSMGFPETVLYRYVQQLERESYAKVKEEQPTYLLLENIQWKQYLDYQLWRVPLIQEREQEEELKKQMAFEDALPTSTNNPQTEKLITMIEKFNIASATPLQALNFIQKLKETIA